MKKEYISSSSIQTKKLGQKIAQEILKSKQKKRAFVIGLEGELGGGKTTFLQGFAKGLGIKEKILSPTFVILKRFKITKIKNQKSLDRARRETPRRVAIKITNQNLKRKRFENFFHVDSYRIKKSKELLDLGFKEIISEPKNIIAVEWADKIKKIMPKDSIWITFEFIDEKKRSITIKF